MKPMLVSELRKIVNGTLVQGSDNLLLTHGAHYLKEPLKPHSFLFLMRSFPIDWALLDQSVPCAVITDKVSAELKSIAGCTIIQVPNLKTAYWAFVNYCRNLFQLPVVTVTGTSGKTTTVDMIKHLLHHRYQVHGTKNSANGRTAHLMYLLGIDQNTEVAVFETAVGKPGDVTNACQYFKPSIGIITNIGIAHLHGCKTIERYTQAKAEMVTALGNDGTLIINADDEKSKNIGLEKFKGQIISFGLHNPANFQASDIRYGKTGMEFTLTCNDLKYPMIVPGYGEHQVSNALGALATVHKLGITMPEAAKELLTFKNLPLHLQLVKGINGSLILDDTWNSTPNSLRAAFQTLNAIADGRKRIAVIGQLKGLGDYTMEAARQVGDMIAELGVDILITVGGTAETIAKEAYQKGLEGKIGAFPDVEAVYPVIKKMLDHNTILLAKCGMYDFSFKELIQKIKAP